MPRGVSGRALRKGSENWCGVFDAGAAVLGIGIWRVGYAGWRKRDGGSIGFERWTTRAGPLQVKKPTLQKLEVTRFAHQTFADALSVFWAAAMVRPRRMNQSPRRQSSRAA